MLRRSAHSSRRPWQGTVGKLVRPVTGRRVRFHFGHGQLCARGIHPEDLTMPTYNFAPASDGVNILSDVMNASWTAGGAYANSYEVKIAAAQTSYLTTTPTITGGTVA